MTTFKFNGKPVTNPVAKFSMALIIAIGMLFLVAALVLLWPIYLPLDWLLKRYGRRGFVVHEDGAISIKLDRDAFRRIW